MSRWMKARRFAAIVLVAMFAVWWILVARAQVLTSLYSLIHFSPFWVPWLQAGLVGSLALTGAVGLARSWWWARMLTVSLALAKLIPAILSVASARFPLSMSYWLPIAWAGALLACVRGAAFLALYEGRQGGVDWQAPRMRALWWAIVLNGVTLILLPLQLIGAWEHWSDCWRSHYSTINHQWSGYWPSVAVAALQLVGLGLLAWQKTVGLLLTAIANVVFPFVLMATLRGPFSDPDAQFALLTAAPGLLAAWLALGFWAKPMWRLLRS